MTNRMSNLGTFTSQKACNAKIAELTTKYPGRNYELRVETGRASLRYYIVCTNAGILS